MIRYGTYILSFGKQKYVIKIHFVSAQVVEFMESRTPVDNQPVHIINIDIQDNHEEATMGAFLICDMVSMVRNRQKSKKKVDI